MPALRAVLRCNVHAMIRSMENAVHADPQISELVNLWVNGFPASDSLGGFARAVRNSQKLAHKLQQKLEELHALDHSAKCLSSWHFAPQRFNTVVENCEKIILHLPVILEVLQECVAAKDKNSAWAQKILHTCFHPKRLIQLALLAEFAAAATAGAHKFDGKADGSHKASRLAKTVAWLEHLELRLNQLFSFRSREGTAQEPLCLNSSYTKGYLQILEKNFDLMQSKSVCSHGVLVFFASGATARKELRQWIAEELGAFRNLVDVFMKGCRGEVEDAVGSSLAPFDIDNWPRTGSPEMLPCPQHLRPA